MRTADMVIDGLLAATLLAAIVYYAVLAPYTKVEESFNIQAIHDLLFYGFDVSKFDHIEFPGVVPRTFIGAGVLATITKIYHAVWPSATKFELLRFARLALGIINGFALLRLRISIARIYGPLRGKAVSRWFVLFCLGEFHLLFYASRTLPNMLAMPLVVFGYAQALEGEYSQALACFGFCAAVFRLELVLLAASFALLYLITGRLTFGQTLKVAMMSGGAGILLSVAVDSFFWQHWPTWPELEGLLFNVVQGKSALWGVEPFGNYFLVHLPNIMGNPIPLFLGMVALSTSPVPMRSAAYASLLYVLIYSLQPHKEWRFIIYVVPLFTILGARGADYLYYRQRRNLSGKFVAIVALLSAASNIAVSVIKARSSAENYPGGRALETWHNLYGEKSATSKVVHLDVASCMTGVTRFGQVWPLTIYDKTEDTKQLEQAWSSFDYYIGTASLNELPGNWKQIAVVQAFDHVDKSAVSNLIAKILADPKTAMGKGLELIKPGGILGQEIDKFWSDFIVTEDKVYIYEKLTE
ncbi:Dol-P-Man:Man(7)GlcNAc(2)-PP-Dol alpha-1,6-mannosyltransferase [Wickerhamiella sorbophila]|uniref:Mannosyltransferase n=1 Tax=Wickerhamiella sorbophila TaxID=45607 RepID=A0A2T0FN09_9ASCO|nr:Dol-P-Man:Man(7)GlcNAc(2)-PP-Dol alpha-1,6-mannosyltransferase [Wickerhamiella sorbophila]PRT56360.1 Dol-P-Man:Man(7)GlcNAc(2)-PP-Dol alpha-1,6-mannosyltransferase [Wickerhamiella sorbophila]